MPENFPVEPWDLLLPPIYVNLIKNGDIPPVAGPSSFRPSLEPNDNGSALRFNHNFTHPFTEPNYASQRSRKGSALKEPEVGFVP